jgi:hypothetical protein
MLFLILRVVAAILLYSQSTRWGSTYGRMTFKSGDTIWGLDWSHNDTEKKEST